jgi:hypothetical protein
MDGKKKADLAVRKLLAVPKSSRVAQKTGAAKTNRVVRVIYLVAKSTFYKTSSGR